MAAIRIPATLAPLLEFCRPHPGRTERPLFQTYADLVTFCAAYGWSKAEAAKPGPCAEFLGNPNAIDLAIFRNQELYPVLLLLGLAATDAPNVARDEEGLALIVEDYAAVGAAALQRQRAEAAGRAFHLRLAELLAGVAAEEVKI